MAKPIIEVRISKPIDENTSEWEHAFYGANLNKIIYKLQQLFNAQKEEKNDI